MGLLTAELADRAVRFFISPNRADGVLVGRFELGIRLSLSLEIHLTEHVQSGVFPDATSTSTRFPLNRSSKLPSAFIAAETVRFTVLCVHVLV